MENYPFNLVGFGGTFDHLHEGHKKLIKTAFKIGEKVAIALTTEKLLQSKSFSAHLQPYPEREQNLTRYITSELGIPPSRFTIIPLSDPYGPAITEASLQAHVSSEETFEMAFQINQIRVKNGLPPLILVIIPLVLDPTGQKLSSSRVRNNLQSA